METNFRFKLRRRSLSPSRTIQRGLIWAALATSLAGFCFGQTVQIVSGTVVDPSNAILYGASVTLTGGKQDVLRTTTDAKGEFRFDFVVPGRYEVRAEYPGFKTGTARITVRTAAPGPLRLELAIADVQETVEVDSEGPQTNTNPSENLDLIRLRSGDLENLPVLDGDVVGALARLLDPASVGSGGPTVVIDGLPSSDQNLRASEIQEVRINNNPYSAEYARPGRGRIEIITKTGSSKYHGSVDFGLRDFRLDARNAFALERPPQQRRKLEANISGPLLKYDKDTFSLTASHMRDGLEPIVYAFGLGGPIRENAAQTQTSTYVSAQFTRRIHDNALSFRYTHFDWSDEGAGAGGFVLPEAAYKSASRYHQLYSSYRAVFSPTLLNEFFVRVKAEDSATLSHLPGVSKIVVTDAFTSGGAQVDTRNTERQLEFNDIVSWSHSRHLVKAGVNVPAFSRIGSSDRSNFEGTFYFASLDDYARHNPFSFMRQTGNGHLVFWQRQVAGFVQDEVKLAPNLSLAAGVRYEWQNYGAGYHNFAPRLSFAYGVGKGLKTVLRGGAGFFYDTVPTPEIAATLLLDGSRLHQILLLNPSYPDPLPGAISAQSLPPDLAQFGPGIRSPYVLQYSLGVDRALRKSLTLTATYTAARGVHLYRSRDVNAPLPPLYLSRPNPSIAMLGQFESSSGSRDHSLQTALRGNLSRFFSGMVMYELSRAMNDTDGIGSFPANNWDLRGEWSRASSDVRHYLYLYGTLSAGRLFKFGVIFSANSGKPYTITTGVDTYRDGMTNARPPGVTRNSLQGTGAATLDLRWSREFPVHRSDKNGLRLNTAVDVFNVMNHVNYRGFIGNLSSPFFEHPSSAAPGRRIQISAAVRF